MSGNPVSSTVAGQPIQYNQAKIWQMGLFVLNNTASNVTLALMGYYAFFTQNVLGLAAVAVGLIATLMRIFDGVTDPIFGVLLDRTHGKLGKFRPWMLIGNVIMVATVIGIFSVSPAGTGSEKYLITTVLYVIYVLGYTMQNAVTRAAQASLTNDPKQRPLFTLFDAIYNALLFNIMTWIITTVLPPAYANLNSQQIIAC